MKNEWLKVGLVGVAILLVGWLAPDRCFAVTHAYPNYIGDNDNVWIGMINHDGGGSKPWVCWDGGASHSAKWQLLGNTYGLDGSYILHGDVGGAGADVMTVVRSSTAVSGDCAGTFTALTYNGSYLDLEGDSGNDTLYGGAGVTDTYGEAGNDYLYGFSSAAYSFGGAGNDNLFGEAGIYDVLYGEAGSDCLRDASNGWVTFDCGADSDLYWSGDSSSGKVSCETPTDCCGFC